MDNKEDEQEAVNQIYEYAANLMIHEKKSTLETKNELIAQGLDEKAASLIGLLFH